MLLYTDPIRILIHNTVLYNKSSLERKISHLLLVFHLDVSSKLKKEQNFDSNNIKLSLATKP